MKKPNNQNAHDHAFKRLMRQITFVKAFIKQFFLPTESSLLKLNTLTLCNANFVHRKKTDSSQHALGTEGLAQSELQSDVVYKVEMVSGDACYIILLFEHQSQAEKMMAFRLLEYSILLMRQHLDQGNDKLPIIMPVVFYHGRTSPYPYSTDIYDCFEAPTLAKDYFLKPFKLVDVTVIPDETLKQNIITAPFQILMKHIRDKDLLPVFEDLAKTGILTENAQIGDGQLFSDMLYYALSTGRISDKKAFKSLLMKQSDEVRRPFMTFLEEYQAECRAKYQAEYRAKYQAEYEAKVQQGRQQYIQEGMQQGMKQGMKVMAKRLMAKGTSLDEVAKLSGFSIAELQQLQCEELPN